MKDTDLMPWGVHKGKAMGDVPFDYLYRYYRKMWLSGPVLKYFEDRLRELEKNEQEVAHLEGRKQWKYLKEDYECCYPY